MTTGKRAEPGALGLGCALYGSHPSIGFGFCYGAGLGLGWA